MNQLSKHLQNGPMNKDNKMTQEEKKELLLKDLCARIPYGLKVSVRGYIEENITFDIL